ncbi:D-alanine--D-alanine ligase [Porticoccus sp. W117]|uniref:D-alanine--D-alanine ligase n=1 Tax=Porticoccus sp. W117 TaxID=3054777 RepID=UPI002594CAA3|nr:D-alanine--D-alanine ligase [Porticoccus sp. W117]MDM3871756.1 D-alanine--D-alanine ligase [Porticoccus sp. W117]
MSELFDFGRVGVIYGGNSAEREVSLQSGQAVYEALLRAGVDAVPVVVEDNPLTTIQSVDMDRAMLVLHGPGDEDGSYQAVLELLGIPYTGSGVMASALAMDKWRCKKLWRGIDLPTAEFAILDENSDWAAALESLGGAVMVKPNGEGSSIGMRRAETPEQLQDAWQHAAIYGDVMAERWIDGAEYSVSILNGRALAPIRLETDNGFYDYEAKYLSDDTRYFSPCGLHGGEVHQLQQLALQAFNSIGCSGWGRVDVMRNSDGRFQVLEVNTIPGMTDHSLVPKAAAAEGMNMEQLVVEILRTSMN